jgi:hypothetical protein
MTVQYKSEHFTRNCMCFRDKGSAWPANADTLCVRHYETNRKLAIISLAIKCVLCDWKSNKTLINIPKNDQLKLSVQKKKHSDIDFLIYTAFHLNLGLRVKHEVTGSWKGMCFFIVWSVCIITCAHVSVIYLNDHYRIFLNPSSGGNCQ